jgi:hypothetical protein
MNFHPRGELFWQPLLAAFVAGMLFAGLGFSIRDKDTPNAPLILGMIAACVVWVWVYAVCLDIYRKSFAPVPPAAPIYHPSEADLDTFDPDWIEVHCVARPQDTHIIQGLPCKYTVLVSYAIAILNGERTTVYNDWKGEANGFPSQDDYKALIDWFIDNHYGIKGHRDSLAFNDFGIDLLNDLVNPQFKPPSPTETGKIREIRTY